MILGLLLEDGPDDEGHRIPVRTEAFYAPDLKAQDLTGSCTDEVGDDDEAGRVERIDGACHDTNRCQRSVAAGDPEMAQQYSGSSFSESML